MVARRKSRWPAVLLTLGALAAIAAGISYIFWPQIFALYEEEMIYATKAKHWGMYSAGQSLPATPDLKESVGAAWQSRTCSSARLFSSAFSSASSSWRCG